MKWFRRRTVCERRGHLFDEHAYKQILAHANMKRGQQITMYCERDGCSAKRVTVIGTALNGGDVITTYPSV